MRQAILAFIHRFRRRPADERAEAADEAEREVAEERRDAMVEAQRRDITRG